MNVFKHSNDNNCQAVKFELPNLVVKRESLTTIIEYVTMKRKEKKKKLLMRGGIAKLDKIFIVEIDVYCHFSLHSLVREFQG